MATTRERPSYFFELSFGARSQDDMSTLAGRQLGDSPANAARGTGYQNSPAVQVSHHTAISPGPHLPMHQRCQAILPDQTTSLMFSPTETMPQLRNLAIPTGTLVNPVTPALPG